MNGSACLRGHIAWNSNLDVIKASKPSAEFYSDYSASRFLRNYQWSKKNNNHWGFRSVWGVLQVSWHEWHEFLTGFSAYFFLQVCDQQHGLWTIRGGATISLVSMGDAGLLRRMVPFRASARRRPGPVFGWIWSPIWMLKDVERCWKMLKDVERCWKMLKDVERCWKMLKDVERWYPLVNVYVTNWKDPPCY